MIRIGTYLDKAQGQGMKVLCHKDDPLFPHRDKPWLREWIREREGGGEEGSPLPVPSGNADAPEELLKAHTFILGKANFGKTRLALRLAAEQLRAGCSVVLIELKNQTILHLLDLARAMNFPPEDVILMMPSAGRPPSWNPLDAEALGLRAEQAAKQFADLVDDLNARAATFRPAIENALTVAAAHRLSLKEAAEILNDASYRAALLAEPPCSSAVTRHAYEAAVRYFERDYTIMSTGDRKDIMLGVNRRILPALSDEFLSAVLCSRQESFDFRRLWNDPAPKLFLAHIEPAEIGMPIAETIGTLLARQLFAAAARAGGKGGRPVMLFLDEVSRLQRFLGDSPAEMLTFARSYDLRVLAASQVLATLDPVLKAALLGTTSIQAFFNLTGDDAQYAGTYLGPLCAGDGGGPSKVEIGADEKARPEEASYPVTDGKGRNLVLTPAAWKDLLSRDSRSSVPPLRAVRNFVAVSGFPLPATAAGEALETLLHGLPDGSWRFTGPELAVEVTFPRPKVKALGKGEGNAAKRITATVGALKKGECVLNLVSVSAPAKVEVARVLDPPAEPDPAYLAAALRNGQTPEEVEACRDWREARILEMAASAPEPAAPAPRAKEAKVKAEPAPTPVPSEPAPPAAPEKQPAKPAKPPKVTAPVPLEGEDDSA